MKSLTKFAILLPIATAAAAQQPAPATPPPPPCAGPENRTLDFWVGDWDALDQQGQLIGTNRITRNEYGDCVITEHFVSPQLTGHSVSTYRPGLKQWRQVWVDNQGGFFDLVGGPVTGSDHIFVFENKRPIETMPYQRMIWQDVKPDSFTWRWQRRAKPEDAWADSWVINYRRKGAAAGS
ncbi:MAG TPA: hypothetical protein VFZ35_05940 [Sphingomicrobium sp.]